MLGKGDITVGLHTGQGTHNCWSLSRVEHTQSEAHSKVLSDARLILGLCTANERCRYIVTLSLEPRISSLQTKRSLGHPFECLWVAVALLLSAGIHLKRCQALNTQSTAAGDWAGFILLASVVTVYTSGTNSPVQASICRCQWMQMSTDFNHVELSRPSLTSINQKNYPRPQRANTLFCNGKAWPYTPANLYFYAWRNLEQVCCCCATAGICVLCRSKKYEPSFTQMIVICRLLLHTYRLSHHTLFPGKIDISISI